MRQVVKSLASGGPGAAVDGAPREPVRRPVDPPLGAPSAEAGPAASEDPEILLERRVHGAIEQSVVHKRTAAVVLIDLDTGNTEDRREMEGLLRGRLRRYDVVLGLDGGQIALCLSHLRDASELACVAERIHEIIAGERYRRTWGTSRVGTAIHTTGQPAHQLIAGARAALAAPGRS